MTALVSGHAMLIGDDGGTMRTMCSVHRRSTEGKGDGDLARAGCRREANLGELFVHKAAYVSNAVVEDQVAVVILCAVAWACTVADTTSGTSPNGAQAV